MKIVRIEKSEDGSRCVLQVGITGAPGTIVIPDIDRKHMEPLHQAFLAFEKSVKFQTLQNIRDALGIQK